MGEKTAKRALTPAGIDALKKPQGAAYERSDGTSGLVLRVLPGGAKVFRWPCRTLGTVFTLGEWSREKTPGHLTLSQARGELEALRDIRRANRARPGDPPEKVEAVRAAALAKLEAAVEALRAKVSPPPAKPAAEGAVTVEALASDFYARRILPHRRRPEIARQVLDSDIIPQIGARPVADVTARECARVVERVVDRNAKVHAGRVLGVLRQLLRFAVSRDLIAQNPALSLDPKELGVQSNRRQRSLSEEEIAPFWAMLDREFSESKPITRRDPRPGREREVYSQRRAGLSATTRAALRILLLTGVRAGELTSAEWSEVDLDGRVWRIPPEHRKLTRSALQVAKMFEIPLSDLALAQFKMLKGFADKLGDSPEEKRAKAFVLASAESATGHVDTRTLSKALARSFMHGEIELPGGAVRPHDLRRALRSGLGRLRIPVHIAERCLGHSLGGIIETYDTGDYVDERRAALERWAGYVQGLIDGEGAQVISLPVPPASGSAK